MTFPIVHSLEPVALFGGGAASLADVDDARALSGPCVAADGGAHLAVKSGIMPDAVIGDFDSIAPDVLAQIPRAHQHRIAEQESTDFDKALRHIAAPVVLAVGFLGGRVDHQLACLHGLARHADRPCILVGPQEIMLLCPAELRLETQPGDVVSLFPLTAVTGTSKGLRWPIDGLAFDPMTTIGTSNEATGPVTLTMSGPAMIVIAPRRCLTALTQALVLASPDERWPARAGQHKDRPQP